MAHINQVNAILSREGLKVRLRRGKGYFYIYSDDPEVALSLATLYTTSIYVYRFSAYSVDEWVREVKQILNQKKQ